MEQTVFVAPRMDQRVMMVPLNGTSLREFDAAIVLGADSDHLPSRPAETLFLQTPCDAGWDWRHAKADSVSSYVN